MKTKSYWMREQVRELWTRRTKIGRVVCFPSLVSSFAVHYVVEAVGWLDDVTWKGM